MANLEHIKILKRGYEDWNFWRQAKPHVKPDFRGADLQGAILGTEDLTRDGLDHPMFDFCNADFSNAHLREAIFGWSHLSNAVFINADLRSANFRSAHLSRANFYRSNLNNAAMEFAKLSRASVVNATLNNANLQGADLSYAKLSRSHLQEANLSNVNLHQAILLKATLCNAILQGALLLQTDLRSADLTGCHIYGISVWNVKLESTVQRNLVITNDGEPMITLDDIEVAQFIHLLLNNQKIRSVIDTITSKVVLILGRFTSERKDILDALREELRKRNYSPILFDFDKPANRDITETVSILAHMARFVIADITDAKSIPQELQAVVPHLPSVPIQPILYTPDREYSMFEHFPRYPWVLPLHRYSDLASLLKTLNENVIEPAEKKAKELA